MYNIICALVLILYMLKVYICRSQFCFTAGFKHTSEYGTNNSTIYTEHSLICLLSILYLCVYFIRVT